MELLAAAVPLFLLALLAELALDRRRGTGHYRLNDAINSLSAGTLSTTTDYFTRIVPIYISGWVLQDFAVFDIDTAWFDVSPTGLALWLLALLGWDFCYYWAHRCGHEISVLWASHAVHHQSEDYNLSTALRQPSTGFLFNWIFYLPLFLIGLPLEVVATVNAIDLIYQFWVHTQHIGKLGWADRVFVTPSNHRVHHAQNEIYIDKNYGGILILWDRLFGTFQEEVDEHPVVFGVRKPLASWNPFRSISQVYAYLWFDAVRTRRWRDKIGIWFRRTGWRPADVERRYPKPTQPVSEFSKFDPPMSRAVRRYVMAQFLVATAAVLGIGQLFADAGAQAVFAPCAALWFALFAFGALLEGRQQAKRIEAVRLLAVTPAAAAATVWAGHASYVLLAAIVAYCAVSIVALLRLPVTDDSLVEAEPRQAV